MPSETRKEHKCSHHTRSRWQNFHFSGKLIMCSVFLGLALILIGGLILVIGIDSKEEKPPNYEEIETKAPMSYVGPAIMGIGGFIVIVGIIMCLVETKVCRRSADARPLIPDQQEDSNSASEPLEANHSHNHNRGTRKKSPSPREHKVANKKPHSRKKQIEQKSPSPASPQPVLSEATINASKQFLSASDKFLTPPSSFEKETMTLHSNSRDSETVPSSSFLKSFTSSETSWNVSTEFQTPSTSFHDSSQSPGCDMQIAEIITPISTSNTLPLDPENSTFITPVGSTDEKFSSSNISTFEAKPVPEITSSSIVKGNENQYANTEPNGIMNNVLLHDNTSLISQNYHEHDKKAIFLDMPKGIDELSNATVIEENIAVLADKNMGPRALNDQDVVRTSNSGDLTANFDEHTKDQIETPVINEINPALPILENKSTQNESVHQNADSHVTDDVKDQILCPEIKKASIPNKDLDKTVTDVNKESQEAEHLACNVESSLETGMTYGNSNVNNNEGTSQAEYCNFQKLEVLQSTKYHDTGLQDVADMENLNELENGKTEICRDQQLENNEAANHLNNLGCFLVEKINETKEKESESSVSEKNFSQDDKTDKSPEETDAASENTLHSDYLQQANKEILTHVDTTECTQEIPAEKHSLVEREETESEKDIQAVSETEIS